MIAFLRNLFVAATRHDRSRRLRLCETLSLGEKRFLAVVECDHRGYLLAGTADHISLLRCLELQPEDATDSERRLNFCEEYRREMR
jgi:flagellar biogenesis protein FliO